MSLPRIGRARRRIPRPPATVLWTRPLAPRESGSRLVVSILEWREGPIASIALQAPVGDGWAVVRGLALAPGEADVLAQVLLEVEDVLDRLEQSPIPRQAAQRGTK